MVAMSLNIISLVKRRGSRRAKKKFNQNVQNFVLDHGSLAPKRYSYSNIKKIANSFNEKLGQGGFGRVYKGILPDGSLVAVKLLTETNGSGEDFINEVSSISRTSHVNIVNLLGFCYEGTKRVLVYEFMPNKSLDKFISNCPLDWDTLYKIAVGVARGLEYLHRGCNTRIVHFDIKPQNILLDEDFCPKISDFGLAKLCNKTQSIMSRSGVRGTVGYIAPEVFYRYFGEVSHKSDVYSYGMMVLDMAGAKNLVGTGSVESSENYFPDQVYKHIIPSETMNVDDFECGVEEEISRKMFLIGFWCIQMTPSDRPSMSKVLEMLEGNLKSIPFPPKPTSFPPRLPEQLLSWSESVNVESRLPEHQLSWSESVNIEPRLPEQQLPRSESVKVESTNSIEASTIEDMAMHHRIVRRQNEMKEAEELERNATEGRVTRSRGHPSRVSHDGPSIGRTKCSRGTNQPQVSDSSVSANEVEAVEIEDDAEPVIPPLDAFFNIPTQILPSVIHNEPLGAADQFYKTALCPRDLEILRTYPLTMQHQAFQNSSIQSINAFESVYTKALQNDDRAAFLEQLNHESQVKISSLENEMSRLRIGYQQVEDDRDNSHRRIKDLESQRLVMEDQLREAERQNRRASKQAVRDFRKSEAGKSWVDDRATDWFTKGFTRCKYQFAKSGLLPPDTDLNFLDMGRSMPKEFQLPPFNPGPMSDDDDDE